MNGFPEPDPETAIRHFLDRVDGPRRLMVACSGGGDSSALLVALVRLRGEFSDLEILAATVDHRLRAASSSEAVEVGELCRTLGVEHHVLVWEGDKPATGLQAHARAARYRLLADFARTHGLDLAVTGHNADDQAETISMQAARSDRGAAGMAPAVLVERRLWVHRPLLAVGRSTLRDYLRSELIGWIDDPSNENEAFERIRTRKAGTAPVVHESWLIRDAADRLVAAQLAATVRTHAGIIGEVDLERLDLTSRPGQDALLTLIAFIGGRTHIIGAESAARLWRFLESGKAGRFTTGGVVLHRKAEKLWLTRELRNLPQVTIQPGGTLIWDGRFAVQVFGDVPAELRSCVDLDDGCLWPPSSAIPESVPGSVARRARAGCPRLTIGKQQCEEGGFKVRRIIAQSEHFLPLYRLHSANALADLAGLEHFRLPRIR